MTTFPTEFSALPTVNGSTKVLADDGSNNGVATVNQIMAVGDPRVPTSGNTVGNVPAFTSTGGQLGASPISVSGSNVGIGTTSPGAKLDVAGNITLQAAGFINSGVGNTVSFGTSNNRFYTSDASGFASIHSNGSERMRIDSAGNVGVGTASPSNKLDVAGNIGGTGNIFLGANTPTASDLHSTWNQLRIGLTGNIIGENGAGGIDGISLTNNAYIKTSSGSFAYLTTAAANRIHMDAGTTKFQYAASGTAGAALTFTDAMTIDSTGNVGIGTTGPGSLLHLFSSNPVVRMEDSDGGYGTISGNGGHLTFSADVGNAVAGTRMAFEVDGSEKVRIDSQGNVGIGTTSPTDLLDVNSDAMRLRSSKTPASSSAAGNAGEMCWDASYLYVCVATNTWRRVAHSSW